MSDKIESMSLDPLDIRSRYGSVGVIKAVLLCRASQLTDPGPRNCSVCPYVDEDGDCKDLEIMRDALGVIEDIDLYSKRLDQILDEGYSVEISRKGTGSNNEGGF